MRTAITTCPLCEATCGLTVEVDDATGSVGRIRGDADDVFSKGFLCPKGVHLKALHEDPDRVRTPLIRQADGSFAEASWDDAFSYIAERLPGIVERGGRDAVASYLGNPSAHAPGAFLFARVLLKALGSKNVYSASTVDQYPKQMASALMFGTSVSVPVPDLDRTDLLVCLGANPLASNGSLMTAPDVRGRLKALRARGGTLVVVDPRRSRTAQVADRHLAIRPGTDALLLMGVLHEQFAAGLAAEAPGWAAGWDEVRAMCVPFTPEAVAGPVGVDVEEVRWLAHALGGAERAAVYGRIGTTTQAFGTTTSWLVDVVNAVSGNLDRVGGAMFPWPVSGSPATQGTPGSGRGARFGRFASRVRGLGEVLGELPVAVLAEEIQTPGEGQVRALFTVSGNPVLSTPNSERLAVALDELELMVSLDIYVNETTRHAHVILPSPSALQKTHYDVALYAFAIRSVANWSDRVLPLDPGALDEWETLLRLTGIVTGQGPDSDVPALDTFVARAAVQRETTVAGSPAEGLDPEAVLRALEPEVGPERLLDLALRCGPFGAGFPALGAPGPGSVSLALLRAHPHGIDLGPMEPRLPGVLRTPSGKAELAPPRLLEDVPRLLALLDAPVDPEALLLVGRRDLRSNNSWMHNLPGLVSGPARCTLHVHPDDAERLGLEDGGPAAVRARAGTVEAVVEVTDDVRRGVVSLPHGWGHDQAGARLGVAAAHAGVNANVLTDDQDVEPLSGTAILNGIAVQVAPVRAPVTV